MKCWNWPVVIYASRSFWRDSFCIMLSWWLFVSLWGFWSCNTIWRCWERSIYCWDETQRWSFISVLLTWWETNYVRFGYNFIHLGCFDWKYPFWPTRRICRLKSVYHFLFWRQKLRFYHIWWDNPNLVTRWLGSLDTREGRLVNRQGQQFTIVGS